MRKILSLLACTTVVGVSLILQPVAAFDLLKQGKDLLGGLTSSVSGNNPLTTDEIASGLKDALRVGSESVVSQLGATDGFNGDPSIHIPLPETMKKVQDTLAKFGMSGMLDDLELRLNRAAEAATPKAKKLFLDAIDAMTLDDVKGIYEGPDDAATQYFKGKMSQPLGEVMRPVVDQSLADVGAIKAFDDVMGQYKKVPFVPDVKADLSEHVIQRGLDGVFLYLAKEEAEIRKDPLKRTTEILKRVFGTQ